MPRGQRLYDAIGEGYPVARRTDPRIAARALRADLVSGRWIERDQQFMGLAAADLGARLLIA
jgi:hypothetical protein